MKDLKTINFKLYTTIQLVEKMQQEVDEHFSVINGFMFDEKGCVKKEFKDFIYLINTEFMEEILIKNNITRPKRNSNCTVGFIESKNYKKVYNLLLPKALKAGVKAKQDKTRQKKKEQKTSNEIKISLKELHQIIFNILIQYDNSIVSNVPHKIVFFEKYNVLSFGYAFERLEGLGLYVRYNLKTNDINIITKTYKTDFSDKGEEQENFKKFLINNIDNDLLKAITLDKINKEGEKICRK